MRLACLVAALLLAAPLAAQDAPKKKKPAAVKKKTPQKTHQKPTAEQIRRFNELQKKQKR